MDRKKLVELEFAKIMKQSGSTIDWYLMEAVEHIDKKFGKDFSENNPELVGNFILACSLDFLAGSVIKALDECAGKICIEIGRVAEEMPGSITN